MNAGIQINPISSFSDFEALLEPSFTEFEAEKTFQKTDDPSEILYLDTLTFDRDPPLEALEKMKDKAFKSENCGRYANKYEGLRSLLFYYNKIRCYRWWCPQCGKKKGPANKRGVAGVIKKIGTNINDVILRQIVFTIPRESEEAFRSKAALNSMAKMSEKIIKKHFGGVRCMLAVHLFGDKDKGRFRPHTHVLIFEERGCKRLLSLEKIGEIKEMWRQALQGFFRKRIDVVDVHCSFTTEVGKMKHRIKYVSRMCPGYEHYEVLKKDLSLLNFCMNELEGFRYLRYFNACWHQIRSEPTLEEQLKKAERGAGEKLRYIPDGQISMTEFHIKYRAFDYTEISEGFYRINKPN